MRTLVRCLMLFSTTSPAQNSQSPAPTQLRGNHAFAGSNPGIGAIFVATSTSNKVAVLRTLPEMPISASETRGCCLASESRRSLTLWSRDAG